MSKVDGRTQTAATGVVDLSPSVARRLYRLCVRAELATDLQRQTQAEFDNALVECFEMAGLSMGPTDHYSIDWRTNTLTLRPQEGTA